MEEENEREGKQMEMKRRMDEGKEGDKKKEK